MKRLRYMRVVASILLVLWGGNSARADATLFLGEPFGSFGGYNPTGHAALYLSGVCAVTPIQLRRCEPGETGVVISRYHRVGGYDWLAIPLIPYLYAVERPEDIPASVTAEDVAALRDAYRRAHLSAIVPDGEGGKMPPGEWIELAGSAYDRELWTFSIETTSEQDDQVIAYLNARTNRARFQLLFHNCADFSRDVMNHYYPGAIRRNHTGDLGIMTPKQAARSMMQFSAKHPDLRSSRAWIPQVPGTLPRSKSVQGVLESYVKSKKYMLPTALVNHLAVGGLAIAYLAESRLFLRSHGKVDAAAPVLRLPGIAARVDAGSR